MPFGHLYHSRQEVHLPERVSYSLGSLPAWVVAVSDDYHLGNAIEAEPPVLLLSPGVHTWVANSRVAGKRLHCDSIELALC